METIIGLGQVGCNIADEFAKYEKYKISFVLMIFHGFPIFSTLPFLT